VKREKDEQLKVKEEENYQEAVEKELEVLLDPQEEERKIQEAREKRRALLEQLKELEEKGVLTEESVPLPPGSLPDAVTAKPDGEDEEEEFEHGEIREQPQLTTDQLDRLKYLREREHNQRQAAERYEKEMENKQTQSPVFDMFSDSPTDPLDFIKPPPPSDALCRAGDEAADEEGYYAAQIGEIFGERYLIVGLLGKGVFSTVVHAKDTRDNDKDVALKIIRNNEMMRREGKKEIKTLELLQKADPEGRHFVIHMIDHFEDRGYQCLVFHKMEMNLRQTLQKYGGKSGISLSAVKLYGKQLFYALKLLKKCEIIHSDVKLDNIVVDESKTHVYLADLGSAFPLEEVVVTPYLVTPFYRAPEIIVGMRYDFAVDVWSVGCCLYELYMGKIMFPARNNNDMLRLVMQLKGAFPVKMLKHAAFRDQHFNEKGDFLFHCPDRLTGQDTVKVMPITGPQRFLRTELRDFAKKNDESDAFRKVEQLADLLEKCFVLNPKNRLSAEDALNHPFFA